MKMFEIFLDFEMRGREKNQSSLNEVNMWLSHDTNGCHDNAS